MIEAARAGERVQNLERAIRRIESRLEKTALRSTRLAFARFAAFVLMLAGPTAAWQLGPVPLWGLGASALPGAALFVWLLREAGRARRRLELARGQLQTYRGHILRLRPAWWDQLPEAVSPVESSAVHAYAEDFHLFGRFSLMQYLDRTVTPVGRARLAELLLGMPDDVALSAERWLERQTAIQELSVRRTFRQRWQRESGAIAQHFDQVFGLEWIERLREHKLGAPPRVLQLLAWALPVFSAATYVGNELGLNEAYYMLSVPLQFIIFAGLHFRLRETAPRFAPLAEQLAGFHHLFDALRRYPGQAPHLKRLSVREAGPAEAIRRLADLAGFFAFRRNPVLHILAGVFFLYEAHVWNGLSRWLKEHGRAVDTWFGDLGEFDALASLATAVDVDPGLRFAEPAAEKSPRLLDARAVAHPLLHPDTRVGNDCVLELPDKVWIITGSNMSGKSTFLRTIGVNALLAMIGAPVAASGFVFRPLGLVASMTAQDDLSHSVSLFYSEVRRIKRLQERAEEPDPPALLFIDEMLRGTNNRERLIASRGILRRLGQSPAAALVATHDLDLAEDPGGESGFACYHFQEVIAERAMSFDYRLKPGPVTSSNALAILDIEGVRY